VGFPKGVKDRILVAAARHCCVCHRYNGVGVEAHHIVQEADGGPNKYENAIVLCFDCHAAAGHYNSRHPRGTKFSPEELRLASAHPETPIFSQFSLSLATGVELSALKSWKTTK